MTLIDKPGRYRMRNGREAVVGEIFGDRALGRHQPCDGTGWAICVWKLDGTIVGIKYPRGTDIISPWVDPPIEGWVNVCHTNSRIVFGLHLHKSRSDAEVDGMGADARAIYIREVVPPEDV